MFRSPKQFLMSQYTLFFQIPFIPERLIAMGRGKLISKLMKWTSYREGAFTDDEIEVYRKAWNVPSIRAGLNYYRKSMRNLPKVLKFYKNRNVKCPTCVIWGDKDWFLSKSLTKGLEKYCDNSLEVHMMPNCGHWISMEAPDEVYDIIMSFIENTVDKS